MSFLIFWLVIVSVVIVLLWLDITKMANNQVVICRKLVEKGILDENNFRD